MLLVGALAARVFRNAEGDLRAVPWIGFALMTLSAAALFLAHTFLLESLLVPASLLAGVAATFGGGMCVDAYSRLPVRKLVLFGFVSLALGSLAGLLLSFLPMITQFGVAMFMPACSFLTYRMAREELEREEGGPRRPRDLVRSGDGHHANRSVVRRGPHLVCPGVCTQLCKR